MLRHVAFHFYGLLSSEIHNGAAWGFILSIQRKLVLSVTSICSGFLAPYSSCMSFVRHGDKGLSVRPAPFEWTLTQTNFLPTERINHSLLQQMPLQANMILARFFVNLKCAKYYPAFSFPTKAYTFFLLSVENVQST